MPKIIVSSYGMVCAGASNADQFFDNLLSQKCNISETESLELLNFSNNKSGEVKNYSFGKDKLFHMIFDSLTEALNKSNLDYEDIKFDAIILATSSGNEEPIEVEENVNSNDAEILKMLSKEIGHQGETYVLSNACSASNHALSDAYDLLSENFENRVIVIGAEVVSNVLFEVFHSLRSLSKSIPKPFSNNRDGILIGEGAATIILETDSANKYSESIIFEGYGLANDYESLISPSPTGKGLKLCYQQLFDHHNIASNEINFISAHGTGTVLNDKYEVAAINELYEKSIPFILSIKNSIGHTMGAASIIEAILCIKTIEKEIIPGNLNLNVGEIDENCKSNIITKNTKQVVNKAINHSFGFGGAVSITCFSKG